MSNAAFLQTCLLLGVFIPLLSFVYLVFFGTKLGRRTTPATETGSHTDGGHEHPAVPAPGEPLAGWVATAAIAASFVFAFVALVVWTGAPNDETQAEWTRQAEADAIVWTLLGIGEDAVPVHFGVKLDSLTIIMFLMVSLCSTCIHVFSIGYMRGDPRFARFFAYLSLFCFAMLGLVVSSNLLFLFIFWELVGVSSYFLIGFWFEKKSASNAAIKAFVVNRVGDFGFMIGLMLVFTYLGDFSLSGATAVFEAGAHHANVLHGELSPAAAAVTPERAAKAAELFEPGLWGIWLATLMGIGLFCGAIGKSAQFPLQVWLPDAMEGPTPVSALIHAATMVAAGVYLVARVFTLFTPAAQMFIAVVGCVTLTLAALIAIVQTDIKRVLAYSTLSQLGYMIFGLGVGAWTGALFHLLTHAFFKALLFLGSGQVIAGCHHEQDMRRMGGLWNKMPRTAFTFLIAVLAISGAGIPWTTIGIGGFYSKDEILAVAYYRSAHWTPKPVEQAALSNGGRTFLAGIHTPPPPAAQTHDDGAGPAAYPGVAPLPWLLLLLPILVAYITPFYMGRCFMLTFMGKPRDEHLHEHASESRLMYAPLIALAFMTLVSGWWVFRTNVADSAPAGPLVPAIDGHSDAVHQAAQTPLALSVGFAFVVGLGLAYYIYRDGYALATKLRKLPVIRVVHEALLQKLYFDHVYNAVFVGGTRLIAQFCRLWDNWIIDGFVNNLAYATERCARFSGVVLDNMGVDGAVNLFAKTCWGIGGAFRKLQTGIIRNYVLLAALAFAVAVIGTIFILEDGIVDAGEALKMGLVLVALAAGVVPLLRSGPGRTASGERR